ncbi:MAG TPA: hypothetical protein VFY10_10950, partial [Dehalococcoidia bacterium]|nr:hypothetical protein [Dehalococcoidia bacterium]
SVPCQCFNSFGSAVACGTSCNNSNSNWNGCGCDQNWSNNNWNWNNNNNNNWNSSWMNSNCHHLKTAVDNCDGIWAQNANGQWQEYCY